MLVLFILLTLAGALRTAWLLLRLWRALPRRNSDFNLV